MLNDRFQKQAVFLGFLIVLFILLLCQYTPVMFDWFPIFAKNMMLKGPTFIPLSDGGAYADYTAFSTFLTYLLSLPFGHISVMTISLPFCLAAVLTLVFIYKLGALHDKAWGMFGALFALFCWKFLEGTRFLALDVFSCWVSIFCFYLVYSSELKMRRARLFWLPVGLILGFLFRGPIGFVVPASIVFLFFLIERKWRHLVIFCVWSLLLFSLMLGLLFAAAYVQGGHTLLSQVIQKQVVGRFGPYHAPRYYFFFTIGLLEFAFTSLFALVVIIQKGKSLVKALSFGTKEHLLLILTLWFLMVLVGFTIPHDKKARYVLPMVPAISLLAAYMFVERGTALKFVQRFFLQLCFWLPALFSVLALACQTYQQYVKTSMVIGYFPAMMAFGALLFAFNAIWWACCRSSKFFKPVLFISAILSLTLLNVLIAYPSRVHIEFLIGSRATFLPFI